MPRGSSDHGPPGFSDGRGLILLLLAAAFLLPSVFSRHYVGQPRPGVDNPVVVNPEDRAVLPLLRFDRVDINRADYHTLTRVPGIGPARARAIIRLREKTGKISDLDDLLVIRGIGPRTVRDLADFLVTGSSGAG